MRSRHSIRWIFPIALIIISLAFFSYRNNTRISVKGDICITDERKEHDEPKTRVAPIWESLSRHLIRVSN